MLSTYYNTSSSGILFMVEMLCWNVFRHVDGILTLKQLERHVCIFSTVATNALVLKHQGISIHSVDEIFIALE